MKIDCEQLSEEWMKARIGSIGGSSIASVVAGGQGKMRKTLMYRLAGEVLSGEKYAGYKNAYMEGGIEHEEEARNLYSLISGYEVVQTGLYKPDDHKHYSPDGEIEPDGLLELKYQIPSIHVEQVVSDKVPGNYLKQIQWGLFVCEKKWCDYCSYSPLVIDKPIWIKRVVRDEKLIKILNDGADKFIEELMDMIRKFMESN